MITKKLQTLQIKIIHLVQIISPYLAAKLTFALFCRATPVPLRKLELSLMNQAQHATLLVNDCKVKVYSWGSGGKPVLLVHGWESRASRFYALVKALLSAGYQPISFDAPGHGASEGHRSTLLECTAIMQQLQQRYGVFESIIAHSLGVLNVFYAVKQGVQTKSIVAIAGICEFSYLTQRYVVLLKLNSKTHAYLNRRLEQLFPSHVNIWENFSAHVHSDTIHCPIYILHDKQDDVVNVQQSQILYAAYCHQAAIHFTQHLGHMRILTDPTVIQHIIQHIKHPLPNRQQVFHFEDNS